MGLGLGPSREGPASSSARTQPSDHGCIEMRDEVRLQLWKRCLIALCLYIQKKGRERERESNVSSSFSPQLDLGKGLKPIPLVWAILSVRTWYPLFLSALINGSLTFPLLLHLHLPLFLPSPPLSPSTQKVRLHCSGLHEMGCSLLLAVEALIAIKRDLIDPMEF